MRSTADNARPKVIVAEWQMDRHADRTVLQLAEAELHIWLAHVPAFRGKEHALREALTQEEIERMEQFYFAADRERFAVAHALVRSLCGRYEDMPVERVQIAADHRGKPELRTERRAGKLAFNLSHSEELVAAVFARGRSVGIDVEWIRDIPEWPQLAQQFHPVEQKLLHAAAAGNQQRMFFDCWARKEAFVKATGEGLSRPLDSFWITEDGEQGIFRVNGEGAARNAWTILDFSAAAGYSAAIAFDQGEQQIHPVFLRV